MIRREFAFLFRLIIPVVCLVISEVDGGDVVQWRLSYIPV